jgi:hypothetical protein
MASIRIGDRYAATRDPAVKAFEDGSCLSNQGANLLRALDAVQNEAQRDLHGLSSSVD